MAEEQKKPLKPLMEVPKDQKEGPKKERKKKRGELADTEMDMTPMIDVTFLLLIFFLCLEFKTLEGKLAANLPKDVGVNTSAAEPMEKLDLRIENTAWGEEKWDIHHTRFNLVGHTCKYWIGPLPFTDKEAFHNKLKEEARVLQYNKDTQKKEPRPITIKTGIGVTYGDVTWVIDIAKYAGFDTITFGGGSGTRKFGRAAK
ncbi:MAG: biopolymer transporter ExbD [Planctomycetota bacterium]